MRIRDNRMDSCPDGRDKSGSSGRRAVIGVARKMSLLCRLVALMFVLFGLAGPVFGQFTVQPMKLDLQMTSRSDKILPQVINIKNTDPVETQTIYLTIVDLTQDINAEWQIIEPNSGFDTSKLASLKDSIRIIPTSVTLEPLQSTPVEVQIAVPRGSRGFSCAGILATLGSMQGTGNLPFRLRFMVPVVIQVMSLSIRHQVEPVGIGMQFIEAGKRGLGSPATTLMSMDIENKGGTFPRCRPLGRIWSWSGGHWRHVTTTAFQDTSTNIGIIPGAKVSVRTDLLKTLPPGKYKIAGELYVNGKRTKRIDKTIEFAGDPDISKLAVDRALDLDPRSLIIESLPGSTRTTMIRVQNTSNEIVHVHPVLGLPEHMPSAVLDDVKGLDMDCSPWITVKPKKFTLKGEGGMQVVSITSAMPKSAVKCPHYYANLDFWSYYPDGQGAGRTRAQLIVSNTKFQDVEPKAWVKSMMHYHISGSKYQIAAQFNNPGLTHFTPLKCKAAITLETSDIPRISAVLKSDVKGYMLPFEYRNFSGIIDLSALDAGDYRLSVGLQYAVGKWEWKQIAIKVTIEGGRRVLETTGTQEDLKQILKVKWSKTLEKAIKNNERG